LTERLRTVIEVLQGKRLVAEPGIPAPVA
jgi:hypothetical protein